MSLLYATLTWLDNTYWCVMKKMFDVVVVGGGIVGLATALAAVKKGFNVAVVERDARPVGASIRNFGFVTVSGQRRGEHWRRAMKTRDIWSEIAPQAGINVVHSGLYLPAQREEAYAVGEAFLNTEMGEQCRWLSNNEIADKLPELAKVEGVLYSPHELRVESKIAIDQLAQWLENEKGVTFFRQTNVTDVQTSFVNTSHGQLQSQYIVICPGNDFTSLYPDIIAQAKLKQCTLQMLRVVPQKTLAIPGAIMSDLSFARYEGFADLPEGQILGKLLDKEQTEYRQSGVHLIVVQSADGSLVIGDSHVYGDVEQPFRSEAFDDLILGELSTLFPCIDFTVTERWLGVYASGDDVVFSASPEKNIVIGIVSGGTGASTGFAFGEELLAQVLGEE